MCHVIAWDLQIPLAELRCVYRSMLTPVSISVSALSAPDDLTSVAPPHAAPGARHSRPTRASEPGPGPQQYLLREREPEKWPESVSGVTSDSKDLPTPGHPVHSQCWLTPHQSIIREQTSHQGWHSGSRWLYWPRASHWPRRRRCWETSANMEFSATATGI